MKRFFTILFLVLFGLFGVVNDGWSNSYSKNESWNFTTSGNIYWTSINCGSYCGAWGKKKDASPSVYKTDIQNFKDLDFNIYENVSLTIYVNAGTNSGTNSYTVKLIDKNGNQVSTYTVTKTNGMGNGSNASSAKESYVTFTPTMSFTGYRIDFYPKSFIKETHYELTYRDKGASYKVYLDSCGTIIDTLKQTLPTDSVTLPIIGTSEDCYLSRWEFIGWAKDTTNHNHLLIGKYKPNSNDTLYSMYRTKSNENVEYITDTIYASKLTADGTAPLYREFSRLICESDAEYYGNTGKHGNAIQITNSKPANQIMPGIITTKSGGLLSNIKIIWNTETSPERWLKIYTSDTAFASTNSLFDGIRTDSIKYGTNKLNLNGKPHIGIRSKSGAVYIDTIYITWSTGIGYDYSIHPKCFSTNISIAEWFEDSVKFDIGDYESIVVYNDKKPIDIQCDSIRIVVTNEHQDSCIRWFHVPIFADETTELNKSDSICDIVILNGKTFTPQDGDSSKGVYVYPGGTLIVNNTYTVDSLVLRRDNDDVPYFRYNGELTTNKLYFELRTDGDDWRWLTLPETFTAGQIRSLGSEILLGYYDGARRATNGTGGWQKPTDDKEFNAGDGFIFGITVDEKHIYKFKLNASNVLNSEKYTKSIDVFAYGKGLTNKANDIGWNVIGNPYLDSYEPIENPIRGGLLVHDAISEPWNGQWVVKNSTSEIKYVVVPSNDWSDPEVQESLGYKSLLAKEYTLKPFTAFFIQAKDTESIVFKSAPANLMPRRIASNRDKETFLRICIGNRKTGCFISNKFTEEYESGDDLESLSRVYQLINGYKLLYSAISDSIIESGVKVYTTSGELRLDEKTDVNDFDEINALYNGKWYNLLHGETVEVSGDFVLQAKRKTNDVTTDLSETHINGIEKFIHNGNIYIKKNNCIFTILGETVK